MFNNSRECDTFFNFSKNSNQSGSSVSTWIFIFARFSNGHSPWLPESREKILLISSWLQEHWLLSSQWSTSFQQISSGKCALWWRTLLTSRFHHWPTFFSDHTESVCQTHVITFSPWKRFRTEPWSQETNFSAPEVQGSFPSCSAPTSWNDWRRRLHWRWWPTLLHCGMLFQRPPKLHCFLQFAQGGKTWKELVDRGALTGGDAIKPTVTAFSWLPYLFHVLAVSTGASLEVKAEARRLAAWYKFVLASTDRTVVGHTLLLK